MELLLCELQHGAVAVCCLTCLLAVSSPDDTNPASPDELAQHHVLQHAHDCAHCLSACPLLIYSPGCGRLVAQSSRHLLAAKVFADWCSEARQPV